MHVKLCDLCNELIVPGIPPELMVSLQISRLGNPTPQRIDICEKCTEQNQLNEHFPMDQTPKTMLETILNLLTHEPAQSENPQSEQQESSQLEQPEIPSREEVLPPDYEKMFKALMARLEPAIATATTPIPPSDSPADA